MKYYYNNLPYEIKTALLTVLLSILTLNAKQETSGKKQKSELKSTITTFNTVVAMNVSTTYNMASFIENLEKMNKKENVYNDIFGVDTNNVYDANYNDVVTQPMDTVQTAKKIKPVKKTVVKKSGTKKTNTANNPYGITIVTGKKMVKYIYPDGSIEIRQGGTLPWRNKNPGALENSKNAIGKANRFAVFASEEEGMASIKVLLLSDSYRNLSLKDAVCKYAPPHENNTKKYQNDLKKLTGVDIERKICDLNDEEMERVVQVIKQLEGWRVGKLTYIESPQKQIIDTLNQRTL